MTDQLQVKRCCPKCFGDTSIGDFIREKGIPEHCGYCGDQGGPCASVAEVGSFVIQALLDAYECSPDEHSGSSASIVLEKESVMDAQARYAGLSVDLIDKATDHATGFLSSRDLLLHKTILAQSSYPNLVNYQSAWDAFMSTVMCDARFFDIEKSREGLIESLIPLLKKLESKSTLRRGDHVYRARLCPHGKQLPKEHWKIQDELGPPPNWDASARNNNRMSPAGISYFYVSDDEATCVAEIQPNVGRDVWVGQFLALRDFLLIDFSKLPSIEIPSVFSKEYDWRIVEAEKFLTEFIAEISQPTRSEDNLLEYVPTQVLGEYIRKLGAEGIAYRSSQNRKGKNYTLFCGPSNNPFSKLKHNRPVYDQWFCLQEVRTLKIAGMRLDTTSKSHLVINPAQLKRPNPFEGLLNIGAGRLRKEDRAGTRVE